ncbi:CPBP family intramembrane metalloprotease [Fructobacillus sp. M2-14]|uniref:CPBP family intramembrane metalloprotease n=1 Tax=Fructobacillus broussonetiae TaxID=2713173 RepID=A0ABS5R1T9_9LACO|nr:CPBP family intramembrane glutamic endopeptidase [Fructobacillus broussonetiae]MBS9338519.1 CPBP family intramembrane metalloprotease [Fructobacillus broussonetiae]
MNYELKRPKLIPLALLLNLSVVWFLTHHYWFNFLLTFLLGTATMLLLFGKRAYYDLFKKGKTSFWFLVSIWFWIKLGDLILSGIYVGIRGNLDQFEHSNSNIGSTLPHLSDKIFWLCKAMFSAVNEEMMFIPILLTLFVLMKGNKFSWYVASFFSGIAFAFLHWGAYVLQPAIIISLLVTRMALNETYKKCDSIRGPMTVHFLLDLTLILFCLG